MRGSTSDITARARFSCMPSHVGGGLALAAVMVLIVPSTGAQDFYIPPPSTVDSHVMINSMQNQRHWRETDHRIRKGNSSGQSADHEGAVAPDVHERIETLVVSALSAEAERRAKSYGQQEANQWFSRAAGDIGREMGRLRPEYERRRANQAAGADDWYLASAQQQVDSYIRAAQ